MGDEIADQTAAAMAQGELLKITGAFVSEVAKGQKLIFVANWRHPPPHPYPCKKCNFFSRKCFLGFHGTLMRMSVALASWFLHGAVFASRHVEVETSFKHHLQVDVPS